MRHRIVTETDLRGIIDHDLVGVPGVTIQNDYKTARRLLILREWQRVCSCATPLRIPARKLTAQLLVNLAAEGIHVSAATLFNWKRRLDRRGIAGLIDGRSPSALPI